MTAPRDIDRILDAWLASGPPMTADRVVADALSQIEARQASRARRWPAGARRTLAVAAAFLLVLVASLIGLRYVVGPTPGPTPSPTAEATSTPTAEPTPQPYSTTTFAIPISLRIPVGGSVAAEERGFVDFGQVVIMSIADTNVFDDVGLPQPWPVDLQAWVVAEPAFTAPEVVTRQVDGRDGQMLTFGVDYTPRSPGDRKPKFGFGANDIRMVDAPERWRLLQVVTGQGQGLIFVQVSSLTSFDADAALLDGLVADLQFR